MAQFDDWLSVDGAILDSQFATFSEQDSGSLSYGVRGNGGRWFVKVATTDAAHASCINAIRFHSAVSHPAILKPGVMDERAGVLVYPWIEGTVLNHATVSGSDRSGLRNFRRLPSVDVLTAISRILGAHEMVEAEGFVAVDFYDGSMLYDFAHRRMHLIDLDEYRPGPFVVSGDRLPGSTSYMAPEEWTQGATIDARTTVFNMGRAIANLLDVQSDQSRDSPQTPLYQLIDRATDPDPAQRQQTVSELHSEWTRIQETRAGQLDGR